MDIIQANIDRFKLLLTTETCNGKAGVVMSQSHGSAPDENVDRACTKCPRQWFSRALRKNILVTTGERLSARHAAPL
jgi:hypothetical protein